MAFSAWETWCNMYNMHSPTKVNARALMQSKLRFTQVQSVFRMQWGLTTGDMSNAIIYMYLYDPLHLPKREFYGNVTALQNSLRHYVKWKNLYGFNASTDADVVMRKLVEGRPKQDASDFDAAMEEYINEIVGSLSGSCS